MLITTICIITIGIGMFGTIFGIKLVMIKKNFIFLIKKERDNKYINSSFLNVDHV